MLLTRALPLAESELAKLGVDPRSIVGDVETSEQQDATGNAGDAAATAAVSKPHVKPAPASAASGADKHPRQEEEEDRQPKKAARGAKALEEEPALLLDMAQ